MRYPRSLIPASTRRGDFWTNRGTLSVSPIAEPITRSVVTFIRHAVVRCLIHERGNRVVIAINLTIIAERMIEEDLQCTCGRVLPRWDNVRIRVYVPARL